MFTFIVPGSIDQITGGYLFDRRIVNEARAAGRNVRVIELPGHFPEADDAARAAASRSLESLPDGTVVVIDGLALPGFDTCLEAHAGRLAMIGFVHHPLSLETGLGTAASMRYAALEARLWKCARGFLCPSAATAAALERAGIESSRIAVTPPGTDRPAASTGREISGAVSLLSVGTISPRKGSDLLVAALADLKDMPWHLTFVGNTTRSPRFAAALVESIERAGLQARIRLAGELPPDEVARAYAAADVFVLPSWHEGYGMAYAEALVHGLPVIATTAGAIPDTVPASAARFVAPGDVAALRTALHAMIADPELRQRLALGAALAGKALPTWAQAAAHWLRCLDRLVQ